MTPDADSIAEATFSPEMNQIVSPANELAPIVDKYVAAKFHRAGIAVSRFDVE